MHIHTPHTCVVGVDVRRKLCIACGVLVGTEDAGIVWQGSQLAEAGPHLGRGALKQAPAAQAEQSVPCKRRQAAAAAVAAGGR